jgi:hypothetical protein
MGKASAAAVTIQEKEEYMPPLAAIVCINK